MFERIRDREGVENQGFGCEMICEVAGHAGVIGDK